MKFCFYLHVMSAIFTSEASIQPSRGPKAWGWTALLADTAPLGLRQRTAGADQACQP